jgi:hypothetical protein
VTQQTKKSAICSRPRRRRRFRFVRDRKREAPARVQVTAQCAWVGEKTRTASPGPAMLPICPDTKPLNCASAAWGSGDASAITGALASNVLSPRTTWPGLGASSPSWRAMRSMRCGSQSCASVRRSSRFCSSSEVALLLLSLHPVSIFNRAEVLPTVKHDRQTTRSWPR